MKFDNILEIMDILNMINFTVEESVEHGADAGGSYESNPNGVKKKLLEWRNKITNDNIDLLEKENLIIGIAFEHYNNCFRPYSLILIDKDLNKDF